MVVEVFGKSGLWKENLFLTERAVISYMTDEGRRYKLPRVADKYGLSGVEEELVEKRTQEDPESLRSLATYFNRRVLRAAMETAGLSMLDGEVENTYRLLTDSEVSSGVRTETRKQLERHGIDVDELESDFVTYQAVRTYLKDGRGVEYESTTDAKRIDAVEESVARLQNRTLTVAEEKLDQLDRTERIHVGDYRLLINLQVFCQDCGKQYEFGELLREGGCECEDDRAREK